jgi:hypothetical protein
LQNLTGLGVNTFMLLSQAGAVLTPSGALEGPSDCARRRRNLAATIVANWHVSCPSNLAANRCYYDCNEAPACLHSVAPVLSEVLSGGSWYRVQLPSGWTAFSLLFDVGMDECTSSTPSVMCVQLQINSTCDNENFAVSRLTRLVIAAPMRGADQCASYSTLRYFVPSHASNDLNYHQAKPGGVFPGTWVETVAGILHLREWIAPPPSPPAPPPAGRSPAAITSESRRLGLESAQTTKAAESQPGVRAAGAGTPIVVEAPAIVFRGTGNFVQYTP